MAVAQRQVSFLGLPSEDDVSDATSVALAEAPVASSSRTVSLQGLPGQEDAFEPAVSARDAVALKRQREYDMAVRNFPLPEQRPDLTPDDYKAMGKIPVGQSVKSLFADDRWHEKLPYSGTGMTKAMNLALAAFRYNADEYPETGAGDAQRERDMIRLWNQHEADQEQGARGRTWQNAVLSTIGNSIPYMIEFGTSLGAIPAIRAVMKRGGKSAVKALLRTEFKTAGRRAAKGFAKWTGRAGARTFLTSHRALEHAFRRMLPEDMELTDKGQAIITEMGDSPTKAIVKGYVDHFIENFSEEAGEMLFKPGAKLAGAALRKTFPGAAGKGAELLQRLGQRWLKQNPGQKIGRFLRLLREGGFDGPFEEWGEERFGDALRAVVGIESFGAKGAEGFNPTDVLKRLKASWPDLEQHLVELGAFSIMGGGAKVLDVGSRSLEERDIRATQQRDELLRQEVLARVVSQPSEFGLKTQEDVTSFLAREAQQRPDSILVENERPIRDAVRQHQVAQGMDDDQNAAAVEAINEQMNLDAVTPAPPIPVEPIPAPIPDDVRNVDEATLREFDEEARALLSAEALEPEQEQRLAALREFGRRRNAALAPPPPAPEPPAGPPAEASSQAISSDAFIAEHGEATVQVPLPGLYQSEDGYVIIHPSSKEEGKWQGSVFNSRGPKGHTIRDTYAEVIDEFQSRAVGFDLANAEVLGAPVEAAPEPAAFPARLETHKRQRVKEPSVGPSAEGSRAVAIAESLGATDVERAPDSGGERGGDKVFITTDPTPIPLRTMHTMDTSDVEGKQVPMDEEMATHEGLHVKFSANPEAGHQGINALKKVAPSGNEFEHLIAIGTHYLLDPASLEEQAPELYAIAQDWLGDIQAASPVAQPKEVQGAREAEALPVEEPATTPIPEAAVKVEEPKVPAVAPATGLPAGVRALPRQAPGQPATIQRIRRRLADIDAAVEGTDEGSNEQYRLLREKERLTTRLGRLERIVAGRRRPQEPAAAPKAEPRPSVEAIREAAEPAVPLWRVKVAYINNPAGPHKGHEEIRGEKPYFGQEGVGAFGRYIVQSKRPKKLQADVRERRPVPAEPPQEQSVSTPSPTPIPTDVLKVDEDTLRELQRDFSALDGTEVLTPEQEERLADLRAFGKKRKAALKKRNQARDKAKAVAPTAEPAPAVEPPAEPEAPTAERQFATRLAEVAPMKVDRNAFWDDPAGVDTSDAAAVATHNARQRIKQLLWDAGALDDDALYELQGEDAEDWDAALIEEFLERAGERRTVDEVYREALGEAESGNTALEEFDPGTDIFEWARVAHGLTEDLNEAGYILPDGTLLDFSGKREGGTAGQRAMDHRQLRLPAEPIPDDSGGTSAMVAFQKAGAVRIDYRSASVDMEARPTPAQMAVIQQILEDNPGEGILDLQDGERRAHIEVAEFAEKKAIGAIRRFYSGREIRSGQRFATGQPAAGTADPIALAKVVFPEATPEEAVGGLILRFPDERADVRVRVVPEVQVGETARKKFKPGEVAVASYDPQSNTIEIRIGEGIANLSHEKWHWQKGAWSQVKGHAAFSDAEKRILQREFNGDEEAEARAFAEWNGVAKTPLGRIWAKIRAFLERLARTLGLGRVGGVFERVAAGRPVPATAGTLTDRLNALRESRGRQFEVGDALAYDQALYAHEYRSRRQKGTPAQRRVRELAYGVKGGDAQAIAEVAEDMAELLRDKDGPIVLVPIPGHTGETASTRLLAEAIAARSGATVHDILKRQVGPSQRDQRVAGKGTLQPAAMGMAAVGALPPGSVFFVDNALASGATLRAARDAVGRGTGLVYAKAFNKEIKYATQQESPDAFRVNKALVTEATELLSQREESGRAKQREDWDAELAARHPGIEPYLDRLYTVSRISRAVLKRTGKLPTDIVNRFVKAVKAEVRREERKAATERVKEARTEATKAAKAQALAKQQARLERLGAVKGEEPVPTTLHGVQNAIEREIKRQTREKVTQELRPLRDIVETIFRNMERQYKNFDNPRLLGSLLQIDESLQAVEKELKGVEDKKRRKEIQGEHLKDAFGDRRYLELRRATGGNIDRTFAEIRERLDLQLDSYYANALSKLMRKLKPGKLWNQGDFELGDKASRLLAQIPQLRDMAEQVQSAESYRRHRQKSNLTEQELVALTAREDRVAKALKTKLEELGWSGKGDEASSKSLYEELAQVKALSDQLQAKVAEDNAIRRHELANSIQETLEAQVKPIKSKEGAVTERRGGRPAGIAKGAIDIKGDNETHALSVGGSEDSVAVLVLQEMPRRGNTDALTVVAKAHGEYLESLLRHGLAARDGRTGDIIPRFKEMDRMVARKRKYTVGGEVYSFTVAQVMDLYGYMLDAEAKAQALKNGARGEQFRGLDRGLIRTEQGGGFEDTEALFNELTDTLTPEQKGLMEDMVKIVTALGPGGNETAHLLLGRPLFLSPSHWSMRVDYQQQAKVTLEELERHGIYQTLLDSGFLKSRVPHGNPLLLGNAFQKFADSVYEMATFTHLSVPTLDAINVLKDKGLKSAMNERFGTKFTKDQLRTYELIAGLRKHSDAWNGVQRILSGIERLIAPAKLAWRATSFLSNWHGGSILMANELAKIDPKLGAAFTARTAAPNPRFTRNDLAIRRILLKNGYFHDRWILNELRVFANLATRKSQRSNLAGLKKRRLMNRALHWMALAELANAIRAYKVLTANGYSEADAVTVVEKITRRTQNPSTALEEGGIYRRIKEAGLGVVWPFQGQPTVASNMVLKDAILLHRAQTPRARNEAAKRLTLDMGATTANAIYISAMRWTFGVASVGGVAMLMGGGDDDDRERRNFYALSGFLRELVETTSFTGADQALSLVTSYLYELKKVHDRREKKGESMEAWDYVNAAGPAYRKSLKDLNSNLAVSALTKLGRGSMNIAKGVQPSKDYAGKDSQRIVRGVVDVVEALGEVTGAPTGGPIQATKVIAGLAGKPVVYSAAAEEDIKRRKRKQAILRKGISP